MTLKYIVLTSELGSGARLLGKQLAEELGMEFYGEENLLIETSKAAEIDEKVLRDYDKKLGSSNIYDYDQETRAEKIFEAYSDTILKLIEKGPCILMERGADIILKGKVDFLNVYTYTSDFNKKIERCVRISGVSEVDAPEFIKEQMNQREIYYKTFSYIERGAMHEYDVCLNTDSFVTEALNMERCVKIIKSSL